jgi:uncharacterized phage infection (PIP) family protein YhgE
MKSLILPLLIFLGSLTAAYFTLEADKKFRDEQTLRLDTKEENRRITALADEKEVELKQAQEELTATKAIRVAAMDRIANLKGNIATLRDDIKKNDSELAKFKQQQKKFDDTKAEVAKLANELGMSFSIDNVEQHLASMRETKSQRVERVDELDVLIAAAEKSIEGNTSELSRQVAREEARQLKINRGAIEAVITGVQQDWGFLVIGAGAKQGFTPTSTLLVKRDGRMIGKVRPSSIEPNQTIAEIIFPSLSPGVRIQPGDLVIFDDPTID